MGTNESQYADEMAAELTGEQSIADLQQEPDRYNPVVPVRLDGPVQAQLMPGGDTVSRRVPLLDSTAAGGTTPVSVAKSDLRRGQMWIMADTAAVYVGPNPAQVAAGTSGLIPAGVLIPWPSTDELFARSSAGVAGISVFSHSWTS